MTIPKKKIFMLAGEHSGDMHGSALIKELKQQHDQLEIFGVGGPKMKAAGMTAIYDITELAVVGFWEVLKNYKRIRTIFYSLLNKIQEEKPDLIVLIDYPGFNLRFAKKAKALGFKIVYYISPQIWAWKKNRIKIIKKCIDKMIVIFDFEKKLYENQQIPVDFVGHPLIDILKPSLTKADFLNLIKVKPEEKIIGLLPGSRHIEIKKILPVMLKTAKILKEKDNAPLRFILPYRQATRHLMENIREDENISVDFIEDNVYNIMAYSDLVLVASGTATIETACSLTPMIVLYKTSFFTWALAKLLVDLPYIGMVNIVAGKKIVPEYVQYEAGPKNIADEAAAIIHSTKRTAEIKHNLETLVKNKLHTGGASKKAAGSILELL